MTVEQMRERVAAAYPGPNWKPKVKKMKDDQIIALYHTLVRFGKIIAG